MSGGRWKNQWVRNKIIAAKRKKAAGADGASDEDGEAGPVSKKGPKIMIQIRSVDSFEANVIGTRNDIVRYYENFPGATFLANERPQVWTFPMYHLNQFISGARRLSDVTVIPPPKEVLAMVEQIQNEYATADDRDVDISRIPADLVRALLPFQVKGIKFALQKEGRILIGDEMGLGKTLQAIAIAACYRSEWPLLVVVPTNLREQWRFELCKWLPFARQRMNVVEDGKGHVNELVNVIGYSMLAKFADKIEKRNFKVIICDESHYFKTGEAQRTMALLPIVQSATRRILLSGTPALSRPAELFPQLKALEYAIFPSMHKFGLRYCNAKMGPRGWDYTGNSNLTELNFLLKETCMIRRMKDDVLSEIPKKVRHFVKISVDQEDKDVLLEVKERMNKKGKKLQEGDNNPIINEYYLATGRSKIKPAGRYVLDLLDKCDDPEVKILVFAHHLEVLDGLSQIMEERSIDYLRIDGTTSSRDKEKQISIFRKGGGPRVFLLSITCAGVGLNLTSASLVVFAELYWNPGSLIQAEDRAHRIGQSRDVAVYYLLAEHSVDDLVFPLIQRKLAIVGRSVNGQVASMHNQHSEKEDMRKNDKLAQIHQELDDDPIVIDEDAKAEKKGAKTPSKSPLLVVKTPVTKTPAKSTATGASMSSPSSGEMKRPRSIFESNSSLPSAAKFSSTLEGYFNKKSTPEKHVESLVAKNDLDDFQNSSSAKKKPPLASSGKTTSARSDSNLKSESSRSLTITRKPTLIDLGSSDDEKTDDLGLDVIQQARSKVANKKQSKPLTTDNEKTKIQIRLGDDGFEVNPPSKTESMGAKAGERFRGLRRVESEVKGGGEVKTRKLFNPDSQKISSQFLDDEEESEQRRVIAEEKEKEEKKKRQQQIEEDDRVEKEDESGDFVERGYGVEEVEENGEGGDEGVGNWIGADDDFFFDNDGAKNPVSQMILTRIQEETQNTELQRDYEMSEEDEEEEKMEKAPKEKEPLDEDPDLFDDEIAEEKALYSQKVEVVEEMEVQPQAETPPPPLKKRSRAEIEDELEDEQVENDVQKKKASKKEPSKEKETSEPAAKKMRLEADSVLEKERKEKRAVILDLVDDDDDQGKDVREKKSKVDVVEKERAAEKVESKKREIERHLESDIELIQPKKKKGRTDPPPQAAFPVKYPSSIDPDADSFKAVQPPTVGKSMEEVNRNLLKTLFADDEEEPIGNEPDTIRSQSSGNTGKKATAEQKVEKSEGTLKPTISTASFVKSLVLASEDSSSDDFEQMNSRSPVKKLQTTPKKNLRENRGKEQGQPTDNPSKQNNKSDSVLEVDDGDEIEEPSPSPDPAPHPSSIISKLSPQFMNKYLRPPGALSAPSSTTKPKKRASPKAC